jgi:hypothetical protein
MTDNEKDAIREALDEAARELSNLREGPSVVYDYRAVMRNLVRKIRHAIGDPRLADIDDAIPDGWLARKLKGEQ